jgi:hypothetical protein
MDKKERLDWIKKQEKEWRLLHGSVKKMLWDGVWYQEVNNKLVKM